MLYITVYNYNIEATSNRGLQLVENINKGEIHLDVFNCRLQILICIL